MKNLLLLSLIVFSLSFSAFADKGIVIDVPLSPAGSFKIEAKKIYLTESVEVKKKVILQK